MMRLQRASLIAVLSLVTSAATAYAECAWVWCVEQPSGWNQWNLSTAVDFVFDTKTKCDSAAAAGIPQEADQ